ncbi:hypothetical protein JF535_14225 [Microbulbifer salipaludis]|uniref:YkuD domain-containing protein n=2 Tax=Microbulbifer salipaludis TaxID=187980 RepID=A0ABS3E9L6_9GAMM|nr:hypothetical protein [Microbulbifer salipaludis]
MMGKQLVLLLFTVIGIAAAHAQVPENSQQLLVTITNSWDADTGELYAFSRTESGWRPVLEPIPVNLGRTGLAWGIGLHPESIVGKEDPQKREGDGKAPAGIFRLGDAFGYPNAVNTGLGYQPMTASHYCIDVPASPLYNQTVDAELVGKQAVQGSSEGMRRDIHYGDQQYKKGIFVAHNPANVPGAGSCIFVHLWKAAGSATAGCTAMGEPEMDTVLKWLQADQQPVYLALPRQQYRALQSQWRLPAL